MPFVDKGFHHVRGASMHRLPGKHPKKRPVPAPCPPILHALTNFYLVLHPSENAESDAPNVMTATFLFRGGEPMKLQFTHALRVAAAACLLSASASTVYAQDDWPTGPVEVVMHTKPGGTSDIFIRTLAESLEPLIGQTIVVMNAPGGGGAAQMAKVRAAKPDGLTLGINTLTHFTSMETNLKGTFSPDDFSWIAGVQVDPILYYVRKDSPYNTMADAVAAAKANPGGVSIGGFGPVGSMQNLGTSMIESATGAKFNWVAYESTPDITAALLGGHVDIAVSNLGPTAPFFESDRIKGLGVLSEKRLEGAPDLPTMAEEGIDVDTSWVQVRGVFGPKDMPLELQQKIADAFHKAMKAETYQAYAKSTGVTDSDMGPEAYTAFVKSIGEVAVQQLTAAGLL
jgi:tripartite-type tricarboxylate transporter receptor subunit TctC